MPENKSVFDQFPMYFFAELARKPPKTENEASEFWVRNIRKYHEANLWDLSADEL